MTEIGIIKPKVETRRCPDEGCGFIAMQAEIVRSKENKLCPRCGNHRMSEFRPVKEIKL